MTDLIKELRVWALKWPIQTIQGAYQFNEILSRHEQEEPLAVLADRKGFNKVQSFKLSDDTWTFWIDGYKIQYVEVFADTYALAEAKARQYLMGLEDKHNG